MRLSHAQRWALLAAFNGDDTDHIHGSTINSLLSRGLIQWIDDSNRYANGRGGYITTPAGQELAETLESGRTGFCANNWTPRSTGSRPAEVLAPPTTPRGMGPRGMVR